MFNIILELFDKPLKYNFEKTGKDRYTGSFTTTDEIVYNVNFFKRNFSSWSVFFEILNIDKVKETLQKKYGKDFTLFSFIPSGTGKEIEVYSTVLNIIKSFIEKIHPSEIEFMSVTKGQSRLYKKFIEKFAKKLGYSFLSNSLENVFIMVKDDKKN